MLMFSVISHPVLIRQYAEYFLCQGFLSDNTKALVCECVCNN